MIKVIGNPKLKEPIFIAGWPGMGEVAYKSLLFLREVLGFKVFAKLEAASFFKPAGVVVEKGIVGLPHMPAGFFYYYKSKDNPDLILFLGEAQPPLEYAQSLAEVVVEFVSKYKPKLVLSFAAKPEAIDHKQESRVWITTTHREVMNQFSQFNLKVLSEGQISGLNGLILGAAKMLKLKGACLLAEIPFYTVQIENPRATISILKIIDKYFNLKLNLGPLLERASFIENEIDKLMSYLKGDTEAPPPLSEEDIERIKKDLNVYTKLPQSVREKIELLFREAQKDIAKARELKDELDHWNVYKDYEDRFLNLFKKDKKEDTN